MPDAAYHAEVKALHDMYTKGLTLLAQGIFFTHVVPFCDKHGLWLVQALNDFEGVKLFGWPGKREKYTSTDWDDFIDCPGDYEGLSEDTELPIAPEGYRELRTLFVEIPDMSDVTLLWFMPEYKPEKPQGDQP